MLELPNTLPQNFEDNEDMASPGGSEAGPGAPGLSSSGLNTKGAMTHGGSSRHKGSAEASQGVATSRQSHAKTTRSHTQSATIPQTHGHGMPLTLSMRYLTEVMPHRKQELQLGGLILS